MGDSCARWLMAKGAWLVCTVDARGVASVAGVQAVETLPHRAYGQLPNTFETPPGQPSLTKVMQPVPVGHPAMVWQTPSVNFNLPPAMLSRSSSVSVIRPAG